MPARTSATVPVIMQRPLSPKAMATWMRKIVTQAALAASSSAASTLVPLKVSSTPIAPVCVACSATDWPNAGKTDSWTLGITRLSMIASSAAVSPVCTVASTSLTDPPTMISTSDHPYWSETRQEFMQAGELQPGERVDTEIHGAVVPRIFVESSPYSGWLVEVIAVNVVGADHQQLSDKLHRIHEAAQFGHLR